MVIRLTTCHVSSIFSLLSNYVKMWASWRNIWDVSAAPSGMKREWYVWLFQIGVVQYFYAVLTHHHHRQATAVLDVVLSNPSPSRSFFGYSHPALANCPAQIVTLPGLWAFHTTFTETWFPLQNSFTPTVVDSTADMASPLPLQRANMLCYVSDFSSVPDHLVPISIPQRNPEHSSFNSSLSDLELMDQPCRDCPRVGSVCHDRYLIHSNTY
jgi:hypothetical protein